MRTAISRRSQARVAQRPLPAQGSMGTNRRQLARARRLLEQRCRVPPPRAWPPFLPRPVRQGTRSHQNGHRPARGPPRARNGTVTSRSLAISAAKNTDRGPSSSESPGEAETVGTVAGTESMARGQATEATLPRGAAPGAPPVTGSPFGKDPRGGSWQ